MEKSFINAPERLCFYLSGPFIYQNLNLSDISDLRTNIFCCVEAQYSVILFCTFVLVPRKNSYSLEKFTLRNYLLPKATYSYIYSTLIIVFFPIDISVREESDSEQVQSDEADAEASPTKSPTTPKTIKCKTSSGRIHSLSDLITS